MKQGVLARLLSALFLFSGAFLTTAASHAETDPTSAVIIMYHRFGEQDHPSTSIALDQFQAHVDELLHGGYTVLPLKQVVAALQSGEKLPDRTVAITIDDAFLSVYEKAWPILKQANLPFTLFVATDPIDRGLPDYMSWDQLAEMQAAGVDMGSQAVTHPHMPSQSAEASRQELVGSADRLQEMLGQRPTLFAYPYGETSLAIMKQAKQAGYAAAFGQHSGVAYAGLEPFYLPRFPLNETYGALDRFKRLANALPLPVEGLVPRDPLLPKGPPGNPPAFGFSAKIPADEIERLRCFHSDVSRMSQFEKLGNRVEVRFDAPFESGRTRINCTVQSSNNRWRWFGMQYYTAP